MKNIIIILAAMLLLAPGASVHAGDFRNSDQISKDLKVKSRGFVVTQPDADANALPVAGRVSQPAQAPRPSTDLSIGFEFNSDRLSVAGQRQAIELAKALNMPALEHSRFLIVGHTDATGSAEYNQRLSERRAEAVAEYLVQVHDIDVSRLVTEGRGESELMFPDRPADGRNRRVEVVNIGGGG